MSRPQAALSRAPRILSLLFLASAGILFAVTFVNRSLMADCFLRVSFYLVGLLVLLYGFTLEATRRQAPEALGHWVRENRRGIAVSLAVAAAVFVSAPPYFRLLADETNLLSVSRSMLTRGSTGNTVEGFFQYFGFHPLRDVYEKRPFLFPFTVQLFHLFTGFRPGNAFAVNFLCLAGLLMVIFSGFKRHYGTLAGLAAVFFVAAQPVVGQTASSAGFDMMFLLMLGLCLTSLEYYLRAPAAQRLILFWLTLMLFLNTRYEAPLLASVMMVLLLAFRKIRWDFWLESPVYGASAFFVLPILWQRLLTQSIEIEAGRFPFALEHLLRHHVEFFKSLVDFTYFMPYAPSINLPAMFSLAFLGILYFRKQWPKDLASRLFILITASVFSAEWILTTSYFGELFTDPGGSRVFTYMSIALSAILVLGLLRFSFFREKPVRLLAAGMLLFAVYHPLSMENRFLNANDLSREYRLVLDFLKTVDSRNFLVVAQRPGLYTARRYGAVKFEWANQHAEELQDHLRRGLYSDIYVVQEIDAITKEPGPETQLDASYRLHPLSTVMRQPDPPAQIRISRVVISERGEAIA